MIKRLPDVRNMHPHGDRTALRTRAAEKLLKANRPSQALDELFELIAPELRLDALLLYDVGENGRLQLVGHRGITAEQAESVSDQVACGPPMDATSGVPTSDDLPVKHIGLRAYAAIPMEAGGRVTGILGFGRRWTERFGGDELAFLEALSGYFAIAWERIRGEAVRRESEERLRLAIEAGGFGTFDFDVATDERFWSPEWRTIYGIAPDAQITPDMLPQLVHPDDRQSVSDAIAASMRKTVEAGFGEYAHEHRIIRPNGELRWVSVRGRTLAREAVSRRPPSRYIGVVQDITARKLAEERVRTSEERLQLAQELGGVASWDWDFTTRRAWMSESFRRIFGLSPSSQPNLWAFEQLVHPEDRERIMAYMRGATKRSEFNIEFRIIRPFDHEVRWIHSMGGLIRDPANAILRLGGISLDVTERKRDEEREQLLTWEVDHRAKNLLNVVQSVVQLTRASSMARFVDKVTGRIHALARVHSLIAASRWEGAELSKLIEEEFTPFIDKGVQLSLTGPAVELRPAAAQSMALVIHELTINAVRHGALSQPDGQIEIVWRLVDTDASTLLLHWRENGGPVARPPRKSGFGLRLIRSSVERQLGGTVHMDWSAEGLRCEMVLPARQMVRRTEERTG